jgi:hypothetical protein
MTEALNVVSAELLEWRDKIFSLEAEVVLPRATFDVVWPLVDSVYTFRQKDKLNGNATIQVSKGECRLRKSRKSSTAKEVTLSGKRRNRAFKQGTCNLGIRIDKFLDEGIVKIRRMNDETHTHDLETSFKWKKNTFLKDLCRAERKKGLSTGEILNTLKNHATPDIAEKMKLVGGANIDWYVKRDRDISLRTFLICRLGHS